MRGAGELADQREPWLESPIGKQGKHCLQPVDHSDDNDITTPRTGSGGSGCEEDSLLASRHHALSACDLGVRSGDLDVRAATPKPTTPPGERPNAASRRTPQQRLRKLDRNKRPTLDEEASASTPARRIMSPKAITPTPAKKGFSKAGHAGKVSQVLEMCSADLRRWTAASTVASTAGTANTAVAAAQSWMRAGCAMRVGGELDGVRSPISSSTLVLLAHACGGTTATARLWLWHSSAPLCVASSDPPLPPRLLLDAASAKMAMQTQKICPVLLTGNSDDIEKEMVHAHICACMSTRFHAQIHAFLLPSHNYTNTPIHKKTWPQDAPPSQKNLGDLCSASSAR